MSTRANAPWAANTVLVRAGTSARALLRALAALALVAAALLPAAAGAENVGHVAILRHDGSPYESSPAHPNDLPRSLAARQFFQSHRDAYDFLIVFPTFAFERGWNGSEIEGLHTGVRNEVRGTGHALGQAYDGFGSAHRLLAYVDVNLLVPGAAAPTLDEALYVTAHEVAHQWSGRATFRTSAGPSTALLGADASHWSWFLSSGRSVLYGNDWLPDGAGGFTASGAPARFSPLDLYLMGLATPAEVPPFTLITPGAGAPGRATDLPAPKGATTFGTAQAVTIDQVIAAMGPRLPAEAGSQKVFRAAFAILLGPGQVATPEQLDFVDQLRVAWASRFFMMTRGRAVMETELVESPPAVAATSPSTALGLAWLLSAQRAGGAWADHVDTAARETQEALEALALFGADPRVGAAAAAGAAALAEVVPAEADTSARRAMGLRAALRALPPSPASLHAPSRANPDGGLGLAPGYGSTVIDTLLAGLAADPRDPQLDPLIDHLLQAQGGDGGWGWMTGGGSDLALSAQVLTFLAQVERTPRLLASAASGLAFLDAHRGLDGRYRVAETLDAFTAEVLTALDAWQVTAVDLATSRDALLADQASDGSWEGSAHRTALSLAALRRLELPNLAVRADEVWLARSGATEGEQIQARVVIHDTGYAPVETVAVQAFDALGRPFGPPVTVSGVAPGQPAVVALTLDTTGHGGTDQLFLVVDPQGLVPQRTREDDRAAVPFHVTPRPEGVDLFVDAGSLAAAPATIDRARSTVTVTGRVGNTGKAASGLFDLVPMPIG